MIFYILKFYMLQYKEAGGLDTTGKLIKSIEKKL